MENILHVNNLTKSFAGKTVVDSISFNVERGKIMGLLGPNGAGKTTAIRMIMGILSPNAGTINFYLNGNATTMDKSKIGYLPEERGLYDDAKVLESLTYLGELKGMSRAKAKEESLKWLHKVNLSEYGQQKLEKLSKGMQQKIQFIAAVLHKPALVMLDEPFSGLDPINQDFLKATILELQKEGITVMISAHQMSLVEELCDSIFMINKGKQVLSGDLERIKSDFKEHKIAIKFAPGEDISFLEQLPEVKIEEQRRNSARLRHTGSTLINNFLREISDRINLEEITVEKPPLHDIFIQTARERGEVVEEHEIG